MGRYTHKTERYNARNSVGHVYDSQPNKSYLSNVCTVFENSSPLTAEQVASALNMAHELIGLPPNATKQQITAIISQYRQPCSR